MKLVLPQMPIYRILGQRAFARSGETGLAFCPKSELCGILGQKAGHEEAGSETYLFEIP